MLQKRRSWGKDACCSFPAPIINFSQLALLPSETLGGWQKLPAKSSKHAHLQAQLFTILHNLSTVCALCLQGLCEQDQTRHLEKALAAPVQQATVSPAIAHYFLPTFCRFPDYKANLNKTVL